MIKWSAAIEKDGNALGAAVDKGPKQADAAALKLQRDSVRAASVIDGIKPSSALGQQVRDLLALGLRDFEAAGSTSPSSRRSGTTRRAPPRTRARRRSSQAAGRAA